MRIFKNAAGWSENSSEITAGWSDGPLFALRQWGKNYCVVPQKNVKHRSGVV